METVKEKFRPCVKEGILKKILMGSNHGLTVVKKRKKKKILMVIQMECQLMTHFISQS